MGGLKQGVPVHMCVHRCVHVYVYWDTVTRHLHRTLALKASLALLGYSTLLRSKKFSKAIRKVTGFTPTLYHQLICKEGAAAQVSLARILQKLLLAVMGTHLAGITSVP